MSQVKVLILFGKLVLFAFSAVGLYYGSCGMAGCFVDVGTKHGQRVWCLCCFLFALALVLFFGWFCLQPIKVVKEMSQGHKRTYKNICPALSACWKTLKTPGAQQIIQQNPQAARAYNCIEAGIGIVDNMVAFTDVTSDQPQAPNVRIQPRVNFHPAIDNGRDVGELHDVVVDYGRNNPFVGGPGNMA